TAHASTGALFTGTQRGTRTPHRRPRHPPRRDLAARRACHGDGRLRYCAAIGLRAQPKRLTRLAAGITVAQRKKTFFCGKTRCLTRVVGSIGPLEGTMKETSMA